MKSQKFISSMCLCGTSRGADFMSFRIEILCKLANHQRELKPFRHNGCNVFSCPGRTSLNINKLRLCHVKLTNEDSQQSEHETAKLQRVIGILKMIFAEENI